MKEGNTISKNRVLLPGQDFEFLRSEGLKYIESLASDVWTDYNTHDPGITVLEVLCYAITELGYRTSFSMEDLLAGQNGNLPNDQCFYTAKNILTINPLTIRDYRKLLIDLEDVQNAWLLYKYDELKQEVPFYADCSQDKLLIDEGKTAVPDDHRIKLSGLYRVLLNLESSLEFGDLNNTNVTVRIAEGDIRDQVITVCFFNLETPGYANDLPDIIAALTAANFSAAVQSIQISRLKYHWEAQFDLQYQTESLSKTATLKLIVRIDSLFRKDETDKATSALTALFDASFIHEIFAGYQSKTILIQQTLLKAKSTLLAHRNLGEDFLSVETICDEEIAVCADIDVEASADIELVSASIFDLVQEYFSPTVHFYTLKEALDQGSAVEDIFEGPVLSHGFINNGELDKAQLRQVVRTSDLVNIIMGIDGVLAVRNLVITKYDPFGEPVLPSENWCMAISSGCKPVLNFDRTKLIFYKGKIPLKAKIAETLDTLNYLQAIREKNKLFGVEDDLPVPTGTFHDSSDYYSVQNDLPPTYGVGLAGLPESVGDERKAQAKQLKAYLLFFDQLLANYFSQLNGTKHLFSIGPDISQTYFTQFLEEAQAPFYQEGVKDVNQVYTNPIELESLLSGANVHSSAWQKLIEEEEVFYERRNAFLDHLLARFAESFNGYVLMMYQVHFDLQESEAISNSQIIDAKVKFLSNYPEVSASRGRAFNYCPLTINPSTQNPEIDLAVLWSAGNISGLEKRTALLTGIDLSTQNRLDNYLFCHSIADIIVSENAGLKSYAFAFFNGQNQTVLKSVREDYLTEKEAAADASALVPFLQNSSNFYAQKQPDNTYQVFLKIDLGDKKNILIASAGTVYATITQANKAKADLVDFFGKSCGQEGLYLVEHLLLRPRQVPVGELPFDLMEVCLGKDCLFCGGQDPYSFRASVVLPYWPDRFKNTFFRKYFETVVQMEAPAHVSLKICWIDSPSMRNFEIAYRNWVNALANASYEKKIAKNSMALRDANNQLIKTLQNLHSEYPLAILHDCEESVNTNVVVLGSTALGTY